MWLEETISPSTSTSATTRVSKRSSASEHLGVARGPVPEAEVLPDRDPRRPQPLDEDVVDELLRALAGKALVERDHHQLLDPERGDPLGLGVEAGQQLRSRLRPDHAQRVGLERQHRVAAGDHLAVAEMDAVELADRDPARARGNVA